MKNYVTLVLMCVVSLHAHAQRDFYTQELLNLSDLSRLPAYRSGDIEQLSSYDRTGGNDDGFSGKYSFVRQEPGGLVIADLKGPGVVNRIWTPTPTSDTVKFYFDGEKLPRLAVPFIELFTGKTSPFLAPLSGFQIGGYYCYLPIPYERSLKIVFAGKNLRFHQTQYRTLTKGDHVKSFSKELFNAHQADLAHVASVWNKSQSPLSAYGNRIKTKKINLVVSATEEPLVSLSGGGRIVGIELNAGNLSQAYRKVMLKATWDGESSPAIDLPLHDFFGYAFGKPAMQSILLGSTRQQLYSYLPMPFDKTADLRLKYNRGAGDADEILITGTIYYTDDARNAALEGKLYVQSRRQYNSPSGTPHLISNVKGRGHYIGTILASQGLEEGHTLFFEGDDRATIDGKLKLHGTGSEDYFNGGWYAVMDRWDRGISLPIHGSLEYNQMSARTGGYRFYLNDKLNFSESFNLTIEHQPEAGKNVKTDYTSVGIFYADKPQFENTSLLADPKQAEIRQRNKLTAQGMMFTLYWLTSAQYEDPAIIFSMKRSDKWYAVIEPDAVPMAQIFLNGLDNGRYKMSVEFEKTAHSGPFSIWQRSTQISPWIYGDKDMPSTGGKTIYAGEIEVTDEVKTITFRKQADDTTVRLLSLLFEKVD